MITLSMSLMGNINQTCPSCNGKRFKPEILKIHWNNKNISEIYDLSISEALPLFLKKRKSPEFYPFSKNWAWDISNLVNPPILYLVAKRSV